ncbi:MAG: hypothetical protein KY466_03350 [Gemmatimonadetes bacterium]|nr:hypothetical protein [Gemmatimonadota bacterium]
MTPTSPFQRFMAELRRRHVPQTVAVYAVAAWVASGGPVEIFEPETWRHGAPQPVHTGDTVTIQGVARAEGGVVSVELEGRVIARGGGSDEELPFETTWLIGEGRGFRQVTLVIRPREGEPLERSFAVTIVPRAATDPEG